MPKLGLWVDDELNDRIELLHEAMLEDQTFRDLKLTKTDVIKMLLRRSVDGALLEHGVLPQGLDPTEVVETVEEQHARERDALQRMLVKKR